MRLAAAMTEVWGRQSWPWDPWIACGLALSAFLYAVGISRLFRGGAKFPSATVISFVLGGLTLVAALLSPLHEMGESLFSAHMVQHELLMAVAAPLLIMGRPDLIYMWALPLSMRKAISRFLRHLRSGQVWRVFASQFTAWLVHALALWVWHIPWLFDQTISHDWVHAMQHGSFLGTALLFWGTLIHGHLGKSNCGEGVLYVFTTAIHTSILGALLTFSTTPWYGIYAGTTKAWGITPLEDQQIGGLIMWIPAGIVYIIVALWLFAEWIRDSDRHSSFRHNEVRHVA